MRSIAFALALCVAPSLVACGATRPAEPPKAPPITYDAKDFTPQDAFEMSFAPNGVESAPAIKRSAPTATSYQPVMASRTHEGAK